MFICFQIWEFGGMLKPLFYLSRCQSDRSIHLYRCRAVALWDFMYQDILTVVHPSKWLHDSHTLCQHSNIQSQWMEPQCNLSKILLSITPLFDLWFLISENQFFNNPDVYICSKIVIAIRTNLVVPWQPFYHWAGLCVWHLWVHLRVCPARHPTTAWCLCCHVLGDDSLKDKKLFRN